MSAAAVRAQAQVFLGLDFGVKRVGVATGNTLTGDARPLGHLRHTGTARLDEVQALVREWQPAGVVVGIPFHPDGAEHANTRRAREFARRLRERLLPLPVHEVDERYSTVEAERDLEGGRGADVDAASAAVILAQFLREVAA